MFSFGLHLHEISFSSPSLWVCMCSLVWGGSFVDSIYRDLVFVSIQWVFVLLVGTFNPFTFKVVIHSMIPLPFTWSLWVQVYKLFLCFQSREDPLAFVEELVWWCWIISAFAYQSFDFSFIFEMRSLLGIVIWAVGFSLSSLWVCSAIPFWPEEFLLKDQLLSLWGSPCVIFVAFPLLLLIFVLCFDLH